MPPATPLTAQEFAAALADAAKGVVPAQAKPTPLIDQLAPYRKVLLGYRERGYSAQQLAEFMRHPKIGINASPSFMRKFLLVKHRSTAKSSENTSEATKANTARA